MGVHAGAEGGPGAQGDFCPSGRARRNSWRFGSLRALLNATDLFFDEAQYCPGAWSRLSDTTPSRRDRLGDSCGCRYRGVSEFCVRLPSPIIHSATALAIYGVGAHLYAARRLLVRRGVCHSAGCFASSGIISTDVPLLFFWAVALYAFVRMLDTDRWAGLLLGLAIGSAQCKVRDGVFRDLGGTGHADPAERRCLLRDARIYTALLVGLSGRTVPPLER